MPGSWNIFGTGRCGLCYVKGGCEGVEWMVVGELVEVC